MLELLASVLTAVAILFVLLAFAAKLGGVLPEEIVHLLVGGTDKEQP